MATINPAITKDVGGGDGSIVLATWAHLVAASLAGAPIEMPQHSDVCVQVIANTAGGATCVVEGSNDGTNYGTLYNAQGSALSFTATGAPKQLMERPRFIRPRISGGGGTEDWTIVMLLQRHTPLRT